MERRSKKVYIGIAKRKIEMYKDFIKVLDVLKNSINKWDGKVINKRYVTAMTAEINKVIPPLMGCNGEYDRISLSIGKDFTRHLISLYHRNRYVEEVNAYVDNCNCEIYIASYDRQTPFINEEDGRLNGEVFLKSLENEKNILNDWIASIQDSINRIDETIETYKEIQKYVANAMNSLPERFRQYVSINCPVYE